MCSPLGTWPTTQACAMIGNRTSDPLVCRLALSPLSHTSQGYPFLLNVFRTWPFLCTSSLHYFPTISHHLPSLDNCNGLPSSTLCLTPCSLLFTFSQSDFVKLEVGASRSSARTPSMLPVSLTGSLQLGPRFIRSPVTSPYYRLLFSPSVTPFQIRWPSCCSLNMSLPGRLFT